MITHIDFFMFRAFDQQTNETVVLKYQKPARIWEYYICREIRKRIINTDMVSLNYYQQEGHLNFYHCLSFFPVARIHARVSCLGQSISKHSGVRARKTW